MVFDIRLATIVSESKEKKKKNSALSTRPSSPTSSDKASSNNHYHHNPSLQLRLYELPPVEIEEQAMKETACNVITQVGFQESATPIAGNPHHIGFVPNGQQSSSASLKAIMLIVH
ncbi:hypothetical protein LINPERPRIM_LOCUS38720 [Linum perenne]